VLIHPAGHLPHQLPLPGLFSSPNRPPRSGQIFKSVSRGSGEPSSW
jgi:hypothetical protein